MRTTAGASAHPWIVAATLLTLALAAPGMALAGGRVGIQAVRQQVGARFVARRLDGLLDEPRSGAPRKISDADATAPLRSPSAPRLRRT